MSVVAKAYGRISEALDTHPNLRSFLTDQVVEWGRITVNHVMKDHWQQIQRMRPPQALTLPVSRTIELRSPRNFIELPSDRNPRSIPTIRFAPRLKKLEITQLSFPLPLPRPKPGRVGELIQCQKAMVVVAIYNARCRGRSLIEPWPEFPPKSRFLQRAYTFIRAATCDRNPDEFDLTMDDLPTIQSYIADLIASLTAAKKRSSSDASTPVTTPSVEESLDDSYFKLEGECLTAALCSAEFAVTSSYLSIYSKDKCLDLDPPRKIKRRKIKVDNGEKCRQIYCYFRPDIEEIDRRRPDRLDR